MRVLADLPHERLAVMVRHRILGLDELAVGDARFERFLARDVLGRTHRLRLGSAVLAHGVHGLCIHMGRLPELINRPVGWRMIRGSLIWRKSGYINSTAGREGRKGIAKDAKEDIFK